MKLFAGKFARIFQAISLLLFLSARLKAQDQLPKESPSAVRIRALNNSLLQFHGRMQQSAGGDTAPIRSEAAIVIAQRAAALSALIQEDPHAALSFAFSPELLSDLAAKFPQSAIQLEAHTTLTGSIEHWIFDGPGLKSSSSQYQLKAGQQTLSLYFAGREPDLSKGGIFRVTGVVSGKHMAVSESSLAPPATAAAFAPSAWSTVLRLASLVHEYPWANLVSMLCFVLLAAVSLAAEVRQARKRVLQFAICFTAVAVVVCGPPASYAQSACSTTGAQNLVVLLVTFPGVTLPTTVTPQSVHDIFFSTTGPSVDGYWREASYGQTWAAGGVYGWYTLTSSYSCSTITQMRDDAIAAASASGVSFSNGSRVFIVFPDTLGCGWSGMALFGCSTTLNTPTSSFIGSISYLSANWISPQDSGVAVAAHEAGHNMNLDHAQSRSFGTEPLGPLGAAGALTEYGDPFSDMSVSNTGHYAVPQKAEILNWISSGTNYQVVQSSGTWTLQPLEANPAGLVALKVQRGTGNNSWIWVEYRQPIGIYESIWAPSGALIHYEDSTTGAHTQLLDFTPATSGMYDSALMPGTTWADPYTNVSITVQSASANALSVSVNYGATPCTSAPPSVVVSPLDPSIYPGQTANYSVAVTNNDSSGCSSSTINLASGLPSGWSSSLSSPSVTLAPGQSASVTLTKGAPNGTPPGTYAVNLNASTSSSTNSGTANATVMTPPTLAVNVSLSASTFSRPGTVPISATVTNGGTPISSASVTFTLIPPNGNTTTQTVTTSSNGVATWNYKLSSRSPVGIYSATANAALSSGSKKSATTLAAGSNTVTFSVQ